MDYNINTIILPGNINKEAITQFINRYHKQENGNSTLITANIYNIFTKLGAVCSYMAEEKKIIGVVFSIVLTLNIGKSSYTTYLCIHPEHRGDQHAPKLIESTISFGAKYLGVNHGYYLGTKSRRKGCLIHSWYRILDIDTMWNTGFGMILDEKKAKLKYRIRMPEDTLVEKGLHVESVKDKICLIYWDPSEKELERFNEHLDFYTIYQNDKPAAIFILFPLECIIGRTGKKIKIAMLTYFCSFAGNDNSSLRAVFSTARNAGYPCLYGYAIGDLTGEILTETGCHVTDMNFYLDFYNHPYDRICPESINIPLF